MIPGLGPVGPIAVTFSATPHRFNARREVTSTNILNVAIGLGSAQITNGSAMISIWVPGHNSCAVRTSLRLRRRTRFDALLFSTACVTLGLYFCWGEPASPAGPTPTLTHEHRSIIS